MNVEFRTIGGDEVAHVTGRWFRRAEAFVRKQLRDGTAAFWTSDTTGCECTSGRNRYGEQVSGLGLAIEARYQAHLRARRPLANENENTP